MSSEIVGKTENHEQIIINTINAIKKIKNVAFICKDEFTIPYTTVFHEPYISKLIVSMDAGDTIQGAKYKFFLLDDTFKLTTVYDGKYVFRRDNNTERSIIVDLSKDPLNAYGLIGSMHLRAKTILEHALRRKADVKLASVGDTLKLEIAFNNLQIEFTPTSVRFAKDTLGFVSRYTIYIDRYTFLPVKMIRKMPYNTSIETILYQKINFTDSLSISVQNVQENKLEQEDFLNSENLFETKFKGTEMKIWKMREVEGDSLKFSKGKKYVVAFSSIGWKPCVDAIPFLKQLKNEYPNGDLEIICIEPFINDRDILLECKKKYEMNYPLLLADVDTKKHYSVSQVPVFMIVDKAGIIRSIIFGFKGKNTEMKIRSAIEHI